MGLSLTSKKQQNVIDARWKEWEPWMTILARKLDGRAPLIHLKCRYEHRMLALLGAGVSWKAIRHGRLDNPLLDDVDFRIALYAAVERRRTRLGRVKGVHRVRILGLTPPKEYQKEFKRQQKLATKIEENLTNDHR